MIIGVARISRKTQNIERQIRNILAKYPNAKIIKIICSGAKVVGYKEFEKVIKGLKSGDTIVFDSASRMSRNSKEGCDLYEKLFYRNVNIEFLKEPYINTNVFKETLNKQIETRLDTGDKATDKFVNTIIEALNNYTIELAKEQIKKVFDQAQKELEDLHQRTSEGIETAKIEGKRIGLPKGSKLTTKKSVEAKAIILKHSRDFNGTLNDVDCRKLTNISRNSYYKYKKELYYQNEKA